VKYFIPSALLAILFSTIGCGNLSPRDNFSPKQQQDLDNREGKISGEIDNMSNSARAEILKLQQNDEIQNSTLDKVQKGMVNLQSNNENSGIQILSGPGGLIFSLVALMAVFIMALHYRKEMKLSEKTSEILAEKITEQNNLQLEDEVFKAAMFSDVEKRVYQLMMKKKNKN
jgi:hypothetical protein